MSGLDPNGGGALVVPGGGGASLPTATGAGEVPVSDGAGTAYTATTLDEVVVDGMKLALTGEPVGTTLIADGAGDLDVGVVAYTSAYGLDTSTGWTLVQGNGTAAIGSGLATLSTASGVNTQTPNRPTALRTLARPATRGCDVAARLVSFNGTVGTPRGLFNLSSLADGANGTYGATDYGISALVVPDGSVAIGDFTGGTAFALRATTAAAALPLDGTGWVRVVVTPLGYTVLTGVGATYAAAVWTVRHTQSITAAVAPVAALALSGYRNGTDAEAFAAVWASPVAMVL